MRPRMMEFVITRFSDRDIDVVFEIQQAAYKPLYEKYHATGLSKGTDKQGEVSEI